MKSGTQDSTARHNVLLVGAGLHARKVYLPWFVGRGLLYNAFLTGVVELASQTKTTQAYLEGLNLRPQIVEANEIVNNELSPNLKNTLDRLVKELSINAVIIATEPSAHAPYAIWALNQGLSVLMDKPISARKESIWNPESAQALNTDYNDITRAYKKALRKHPNILFSVSSQRRYHAGFGKVFEKIKEVVDKTNTPVTSIQSSHADGQWRLPDELIDIPYHGFTNGYGKISHSGYHFFDFISEIIRQGVPPEKYPDSAEVSSVLSTPNDFLAQLTLEDYKKILPKLSQSRTQLELENAVTDFGEIDAFALVAFKKSRRLICTAQISLQHNSFSRRSWIEPAADLYKGNGRVKHEHHTIQQGPFQTIQIHSYQLRSSMSGGDDYQLGGRNHFDIYIFRNADILGGKHLEKISINDILGNPENLDLLTELVKSTIIDEFFSFLNGSTPRKSLKSDILTHKNSVALMAATYAAHLSKNGGVEAQTISWKDMNSKAD